MRQLIQPDSAVVRFIIAGLAPADILSHLYENLHKSCNVSSMKCLTRPVPVTSCEAGMLKESMAYKSVPPLFYTADRDQNTELVHQSANNTFIHSGVHQWKLISLLMER